MEKKIVDILGTEYSVTVCGESEEPRLCGCDGFCDETSKEIFAETYERGKDDLNAKKNLDVQTKKVIRHEIIHAFLFESGLAENSPWAQNEEMVDWVAKQFPKLEKAFAQADAM